MDRDEDVAVPTVGGGRPLLQRERFVRRPRHDGLEAPLHDSCRTRSAISSVRSFSLKPSALACRGCPHRGPRRRSPGGRSGPTLWVDLLRQQRRIRRRVRRRRWRCASTAAAEVLVTTWTGAGDRATPAEATITTTEKAPAGPATTGADGVAPGAAALAIDHGSRRRAG